MAGAEKQVFGLISQVFEFVDAHVEAIAVINAMRRDIFSRTSFVLGVAPLSDPRPRPGLIDRAQNGVKMFSLFKSRAFKRDFLDQGAKIAKRDGLLAGLATAKRSSRRLCGGETRVRLSWKGFLGSVAAQVP